ncbi:DUF1090 family protein [Pseudomonas graminis]
MKRFIIIISSILFSLSVFSAHAGYNRYGCEIKKQKIQQQLQYADRYGNHYRIAGLKRALEKVNYRCGGTDSNILISNKDRVENKKYKVMKRERDLEKAKASGK